MGETGDHIMLDELARANQIPGEAVRLIEDATLAGLTMRIAGSVAVWLSCPVGCRYWNALDRRALHDIDFWARSAEERKLKELFESRGYVADAQLKHMHEWGIKRLIYEHPQTGIKIDVFMDQLVMAHTIEFEARLAECAGHSVPPTDLLLSKLQIHEITRNDLIDLVVILSEHQLGEGGIDVRQVASVLSEDWGFWYDSLANLGKIREYIEQVTGALESEFRESVLRRIEELRQSIETCSKQLKWKMRNRIGTKVRWYEIVGEVER
jgi:hypothetical protein